MINREEFQATRRLRSLARIAYLVAAVLLGRLFFLQIINHEEYRRLAQQQQEKAVEIRAPRGAIFDRNMQRLAVSLPLDSVCINPARVPDRTIAADILAGVLDLDAKQLLERMETAARSERGFGFLWVARKITPAQSERLRKLKLDWIELRNETKRYYPKKTLCAHVLGGVDHAEVGNSGIELSLERELRGRPGLMRMLRDVKDRGFDSRVARPPQPGKNIILTIDERIQFMAEEELAAAVKNIRCRAPGDCPTGSVVVMDPSNGEVLAMASYPPFDPNEPVDSAADLAARVNQALTTAFEPGSVFKVITLSAGLGTTNLRPDSLINCHNGAFTMFGRTIHEAKHGYGTLSMADVLAKSSNIGAIQVALAVGPDNMVDYMRRFGFGRPTQIELPAESGGLVWPREKWSKVSIGSVAMGHEVMTTTTQLTAACSIIANGGLRVKPHVVLKKQLPDGTFEPASVPPPERAIDHETAFKMQQMMEGVVLHGTGRGAKLKGWNAAGKTGSAQRVDPRTGKYTHGHDYNASFMGFAPMANPRLAVVVTINGSPQFGGTVAAPVFQKIMMAALRILDVPKDQPIIYPEPAPESIPVDDLAIAEWSAPEMTEPPVKADTAPAPTMALIGPRVPDFHGLSMNEVFSKSMQSGMQVEFTGSGIARGQVPPAGAILPPGERVRVIFAR